MTQQAVSGSPLATVYQSDLTRTIGVRQQLQVLCTGQGNDTSLADVIRVIRDRQREFGQDSQLESVIQALVGRHLGLQLAARRQHLEATEALQ